MKRRRFALLALVLALSLLAAACGSGGGATTAKPDGTKAAQEETKAPEADETKAPEADKTEAPEADATEAPEADATEAPAGDDTADSDGPEPGKDTNNGRPYNLEPIAYDTRNPDKYLNGINGTVLPVTTEDVTLQYWTSFSSTIMQEQSECEAFQELERRTGVKIEWIYPPVGQETDNFNLRVNSDDLPHIFRNPPNYAGGYSKAVADGIYMALTPYYDRGLMPNIKWLRENSEEINRDIVSDDGGIYFFPMIDIVPSHPWSGLWVREDWVKELGLELPETIDDWTAMLTAMRDAKDIQPLAINLTAWYGVQTNYAFAASYDVGYAWYQKDGQAYYGPAQPEFRGFVELLRGWYADGLIDPDFATRDNASYTANIANEQVGAAGLAYGELGQIKTTAQLTNPDFQFTPVKMPTSYDGQVIHLHQNNSTVRADREYFTTRLEQDGLADVAVRWKDYWYSQDGGDLMSYGPEGVSYEWKDDGEYEWIYPRLDNEEGLNFWTVYPLFKVHNWGYLRNSAAYEFEPEVFLSIDTWSEQDASWLMPDNISLTAEESAELNEIMVNVTTYRDEMIPKFIIGQESMDNFQSFVDSIEGMGLARAVEIQTGALERYFNRK